MSKNRPVLCPGGPLRQLLPEDGPSLLELLRREAEAGRLAGESGELTPEGVQLFILSALLTVGDDFRAVSDDRGRFLGLVGLKDISREKAEFCIVLEPDARGTGLARIAAGQLLREAFSQPEGPERIFMYTRPDNAATCGFNRAMGFRRQEPEADAAPGTEKLNWYGISREEFLSGRQP